jgi:hypothetical protein
MLARIAAVGMILGVMPYVPGKIWTATRYTYMALPFFGIRIAIAAGYAHHYAVRLSRPAAHVLAAAALFAVGGLYAWQTIVQTDPFLKDTDRWELLTTQLRNNYDTLPQGSTVYVIDDQDLWTNPLWQPTWMTSVGHALYGDGVTVRAIPSRDLVRMQDSLDDSMYLVRYEDGELRQVTAGAVIDEAAGE